MRKFFRGRGPIWLSMEVPKKQKNGEEKGGVKTRAGERREECPNFFIRKEGGCVWFGEIRLVHFNL